MFEYFYHGTIRKVVVAFASMFNDIYVSRKDENGVETERFKVPVAYGPQQKFLRRLDRIGESFDTNQIRLETYLPRIGFEITNLQYDSARKLNTIQQTAAYYAGDRSQLTRRYERVPYNMTLSVSIMSKTMDDALQIVEQILPYFGPEYTFTIKAVNPTDQDVDVPVVFSSASLSDGDDGSYGDYSTRKITLANLQFVAKVYLYGPVNRQKVILSADTNIFDTKWFGATGPTYVNIDTTVKPGITAGGYKISLNGPGPTGGTGDGAIVTITEYPNG
jgi:hypothetical protein